jgi:hypothetical protein
VVWSVRCPPQDKHRNEIEQYQQPDGPRNQMAVVGQEPKLKREKHQNRGDGKRKPSDHPEQAAQPASALARRTGKDLSEQRIG